MIYLDLEKQKRTLQPNEFTIDANSNEAKAFFTAKGSNQELVIDLENKTTYFEEYELDDEGNRYRFYKADKIDGIYVPDLEAIEQSKLEEDKAKQIAEATKYLSDTDWVIVKITEMQLEGVDVTSLMEKYKEELINRTYYRNLINSLES